MTPITFKSASSSGHPVTIIAERIVCWAYVRNTFGNSTEITLDTGKTVLVDGFPEDVEKKLKEALKPTA